MVESQSVMERNSTKTNCRVVDLGTTPYRVAWDLQRQVVDALQRGHGSEVLLLLEHPHVFTLGRNTTGDALLVDKRTVEKIGVEFYETDRGGDVTYHGPGQLVGYPIISLEPSRRDIRRYVYDLEETLIRTMSDFGIGAQRHPIHRGVWTESRKIASVGVRISRWVTCHGFALNVSTDLSYYSYMNPCGIEGCEMTSMSRELKDTPAMADVKSSLIAHFETIYGRRTELETAG